MMKINQQVKYKKINKLILLATFLGLMLGCHGEHAGNGGGGSAKSPYPGTEEGAKALLNEFLKNGADFAALTKPLQPTSADYNAIFDAEFAKQADTTYTPAWNKGEMVIGRKPEQTEVKLWSATSEDLKKWNEKAQPFPGGYKDVAARFKDGLTIYRFKFVKPGEDLGMAYDGLIYVNEQWKIIPKPWRIGN